MRIPTSFTIPAQEPALVLHWPTAGGGLWDSKVSEMVTVLEESLDVFVTSSGAGPGGATLVDAGSAVRFMGCPSAIIVAREGEVPAHEEVVAAASRFACPIAVIEAPWSEEEIASAYRFARQHALRAA